VSGSSLVDLRVAADLVSRVVGDPESSGRARGHFAQVEEDRCGERIVFPDLADGPSSVSNVPRGVVSCRRISREGRREAAKAAKVASIDESAAAPHRELERRSRPDEDDGRSPALGSSRPMEVRASSLRPLRPAFAAFA
jgi:hypothetical protein